MRYLIDTNVLLRFLRNDHAEHSPAAKAIFVRASTGEMTLVIHEIVVAEAVWVLTSYYKTKRDEAADVLGRLIEMPGIECPTRGVVADALRRFGSTNYDYLDCHLAAMAASDDQPVISFDSDLQRFGDIKAMNPLHGGF